MASRRALLMLSALALLQPALAVENNFDFYPKNSQSCLYDAADAAKCGGGSIAALNTCLCGNNNDFILNTAKCLGQKDPGDVDNVYSTMSEACSNSNTPIAVTEDEFKASAKDGASATTTGTASATGASTTTSGVATRTATPTQTGDSDDDDGGLSKGAIIGIAAGGAVLGIAAIAGIIFFILRRRKRGGEESHPMLPQYQKGATTFPPTDPSPNLGQQYQDNEAKGAWSSSPDPNKRWSDQTAYTGGYSQPSIAELPPQPGAVFEMDGGVAPMGQSTGPVELPSTAPQGQQQSGWPR